MDVRPASNFACPIDGLPLASDGKRWICSSGHSFDVAREGYCNLLPAQHKASLDPGDSKEMVVARRRFLDAGHYAPISDRLFFLAARAFDEGGVRDACLVDAGCGEGYHIARIAALTQEQGRPGRLTLAGMDVSKWAVKAAARRGVPAAWAVASNRRPPFVAGSVDLIACAFGFPHWAGFAGVLKEGGHVLLADPGPDHLVELRRIIYETVRQSLPPPLDAAQKAGFVLVAEETLVYKTAVEGAQAVGDLLRMTPHGARVPKQRRGEVEALSGLGITVDVTFRLLGRRAAARG
ncbi:MAG: methyltransferase domain-containing protein [Hyphomicrobiaceae bacterium]|nr:methyltransferase domain-containing protein [Hyphomicrobiaceae bacterium]